MPDERTPEEREAGIRAIALKQKSRHPWRGDGFTYGQVLFLFEIIDGLRARLEEEEPDA